MIQPLWKMVLRFLIKLGIKPTYDPAFPLLGLYPEETRVEKYTDSSVRSSPVYNGQGRKAA